MSSAVSNLRASRGLSSSRGSPSASRRSGRAVPDPPGHAKPPEAGDRQGRQGDEAVRRRQCVCTSRSLCPARTATTRPSSPRCRWRLPIGRFSRRSGPGAEHTRLRHRRRRGTIGESSRAGKGLSASTSLCPERPSSVYQRVLAREILFAGVCASRVNGTPVEPDHCRHVEGVCARRCGSLQTDLPAPHGICGGRSSRHGDRCDGRRGRPREERLRAGQRNSA